MSNSDFTNGKYQNPDFLSIDELREILRLDLDVQDEDTDPEYQDYIFRVMEVLELREPAFDALTTQSTEEAWTRFLAENPSFPPSRSIVEQNYTDTVTTQKKKNHIRRFSFSRILIASVMTILLFASVTASAFNFNVFEIIGRWTQDLFHLGASSENRVNEGFYERSLDSNNEFLEVLEQAGVTAKVVPKWYPPDFTFTATEKQVFRNRTIFFGSMTTKDGLNLAITITQYVSLPENLANDYEKSASDVERYKVAGFTHYIFKNYNKLLLAWLNQNYEVSITGDISEKEAYQIIDSIYKEK